MAIWYNSAHMKIRKEVTMANTQDQLQQGGDPYEPPSFA